VLDQAKLVQNPGRWRMNILGARLYLFIDTGRVATAATRIWTARGSEEIRNVAKERSATGHDERNQSTRFYRAAF
jgi:hypothetical protein